uniref:RNA polymerase II-associated protein 1 N-terminal domain-containing protein n=1 Tax=Anopheles quadriannulatus TaxID=34691 RepID=A0A182WSC2_ANOQN
MIKRPSKKDSENEILRMQQEFYAEQNRDANFQPAAKVVRVQREGETPAASSSSSSAGGTVRQSEFAKRRAQRLQAQQATTPATAAENMATDDEAEAPTEEQPPPSTESLVMGEVVERKPEQTFAADLVPSTVEGSFPKTMHITAYPVKSQVDGPKKSIFAQMISKGKAAQPQKNEAVESKDKIEFEEPSGSALLEGWDATEIHNENLRKLNQMSIEEISKERSHLLNTLDPKLVEFLKARKKPSAADAAPVAKEPALSEKAKEKCKPVANAGLLPAGMEVLKERGSEQWINFDVLEPEKLEWTKDIERSVKELKPGESYEARFDWKGVLQPYVADTNPQQMDDRELYLHGEDAQRPGYTLQELFRLARSNVLQQRISALGAIAGMLNILNQGFYDGVLELPVSKVFFFLRFALDENTPSVVEVASRALASLFYNDTDEILLDTVFDTEYGMVQPELALNITHSHEEERRQREQEMAAGFGAMNLSGGKGSRPPRKAHFKANLPDPDDPDDVHNRETMNDFHLAETDLMECLVRTNILERIRYILFAMKPEGATVINCTKILIRLARTSEQMALKIATNEALIGGLVKNYLTSIESPEREHQPQHVVLKLVRVLCGYGAHFYDLYLNRFHVVQLAKRYVFSRKDIDMRMIQVQIEAFRFFRLLLDCKPDDELYR